MLSVLSAIVVAVGATWAHVIPENPCPNTFAYKHQNGIYFGEISIPFDGSRELNLAVNISMVGLYQDLKLKLELVTPPDLILSSSAVKYRVYFPFRNVIPRITQITFNGNIYCYGPSEPVSQNGVTNLWSNIIYRINQYTYGVHENIHDNPFLDTTNPANSPSNSIPRREEESCGISNDIQTLVLKGDKTVENEFPWLVAMFRRQGVSYNFQCTANLISDRHVITAAHCVRYFNAPLVPQEDILLVLGHSDISHWASTNAIIRTALKVTPHPNYRQNSGHCDVVVIKMNEEVRFKATIRPICLWDGDDSLKRVEGLRGVVAGWGKGEANAAAVAEPHKVSMPVASQEECLRSHHDFRNLTSDKTFCAGNRDGSGPCSGDSGAGFMMKRSGKWFLRGLVSQAILKENFSCDLNEYIVLSDVAKFKDWIRSVMQF